MVQGSKTKKPGKPKQSGGREKKGIMKKGCKLDDVYFTTSQ